MTRIARLLSVVLRLLEFFTRAMVIRFYERNPVRQRYLLAKNTTYIARRMLRIFRIDVNVINAQNLESLKEENHLIVSNHVSYTDILILASLHPFVFITSLEMGANPVLGDITRLGGSLYTNRKKYTTLPAEIRKFSDSLSTGFNLVLFAEGTSTNGETIKPMKKSLFETSIIAKKPVLPVCIKYKTLNGSPIKTQLQRDIVCWYDRSMDFISHLWNILNYNIEAEVTVFKSLAYDISKNRRQLCDEIQELLLETYHNS
jgi:1-acyl-sn-glycerol-3-phosphate acyltransferase